MALIETRDLTFTFRSRGKVVNAVHGLTLAVEPGTIVGLLGPNGAGKTTTMRMLTTLLLPTGGQASVCGHDIAREPAQVRTRIGYIGQSGGTNMMATAREHLILQARLYGMIARDAWARADELIDRLQLSAFADRIARTYSGGQKRRLDVALGMVHRPKLLFMDEPTTGLDPQSRAYLWDEVRQMRAEGTAIFLTTHYLDEADALCDRVAIMDGGRLVTDGTPAELKRQLANDLITLRLAGADAISQAEDLLGALAGVQHIHPFAGGLQLDALQGETLVPVVVRQLDQAGIPVQTVSLAHPSLDDVFLRLTGRSLRETTQA